MLNNPFHYIAIYLIMATLLTQHLDDIRQLDSSAENGVLELF